MEYSSSQTCLTATGTHVPYGMTQFYLPLPLAKVTFPPMPQPMKAGTQTAEDALLS